MIWIEVLFGSGVFLLALFWFCSREKKAPVIPVDRDLAAVEDPGDGSGYWRAARERDHGYSPNWVRDAVYLKLLYAAADRRHGEAMLKLSDYAKRRGKYVEAYYWALAADLRVGGQEVRLQELYEKWQDGGCGREHDNVSDHFTSRQGSLARAALRLRGGFHVNESRERIVSYARSGMEDARLILERGI